MIQTENSYPERKNLSFETIWNQLISDKYSKLPQEEVSFFKLYKDGKDQISKDALRTLNSYADILEPFDKLAHPNGICFKGLWKIDRDNEYSGYFKNGSEALIIARASSAMSKTKSGETRSFGFAGKLFPTIEEKKVNATPSANFFLIDDLGGTDSNKYSDITLTNEPSVSLTFEVIKNLLYAIKVSSAFKNADKNPTIRQLYEISELGEDRTTKSISPKWMKITLSDKSDTINAEDFRDELKIENNKELLFDISVASSIKNEKKEWQKIGTIKLDTSVVSSSCDHRLHFHHPLFRDDLEYRDISLK